MQSTHDGALRDPEHFGGFAVGQPVDVDELEPGELRVDKHRVLVGTATSAVELGEVKAVGKRAMSAPDWARGVRPEAVERLG